MRKFLVVVSVVLAGCTSSGIKEPVDQPGHYVTKVETLLGYDSDNVADQIYGGTMLYQATASPEIVVQDKIPVGAQIIVTEVRERAEWFPGHGTGKVFVPRGTVRVGSKQWKDVNLLGVSKIADENAVVRYPAEMRLQLDEAFVAIDSEHR